MACKYCGKDNMLIMDNILTGGVCTECRNNVREKFVEKKDKIQSLGLMTSFVNYMNVLKKDCGILQLKDVKEDNRRKFPIVLIYTGVNNKSVQEIEISVFDDSIKVVYICGNKIGGMFIDKEGKYTVIGVKERKIPKGGFLK